MLLLSSFVDSARLSTYYLLLLLLYFFDLFDMYVASFVKTVSINMYSPVNIRNNLYRLSPFLSKTP